MVLVAFLFGTAAALRWLPPLESRTGRMALLVSANLFGAAVAVVVDELYVAIRSLSNISNLHVSFSGELTSAKEAVVTSTAQGMLLYGGVLAALATIVYVLGAASEPV